MPCFAAPPPHLDVDENMLPKNDNMEKAEFSSCIFNHWGRRPYDKSIRGKKRGIEKREGETQGEVERCRRREMHACNLVPLRRFLYVEESHANI